MGKALVFNKEHPNGYVCEVDDKDLPEEVAIIQPTAEERLAALESAMLELIKGGMSNV